MDIVFPLDKWKTTAELCKKGLPWNELDMGASGLADHAYLNSATVSLLALYDIGQCLPRFLGDGANSLDMAYIFTVAYLLPEIFTTDAPPIRVDLQTIAFFVEERYGKEVDRAPLDRRISTAQQVRQLLGTAMNSVCARYPELASTFLFFDPTSATLTSMNLQGLAMVQAATANVWNLMMREEQRLVFYMTTTAAVAANVVDTKTPFSISQATMTAASLIETVCRLHTRRENGGKMWRTKPHHESHATYGDPCYECERPVISRWAMMHCLAQAMRGEDGGRSTFIETPLPEPLLEFENMQAVCKPGEFPPGKEEHLKCISAAFDMTATQARHVPWTSASSVKVTGDAVNKAQKEDTVPSFFKGECYAVHLSGLMQALRLSSYEKDKRLTKDLEHMVHTKQESIKQKGLERDKLPKVTGIGLYLHLMAEIMLDAGKALYDEASMLSPQALQREEDIKLWRFLSRGVLDYAHMVHPPPLADNECAKRAASPNVRLIQYDLSRVHDSLWEYIKNAREFIAGNTNLPLMYKFPAQTSVCIPELNDKSSLSHEIRGMRNISDRFYRFAEILQSVVGTQVYNDRLRNMLLQMQEELTAWQ